MHNYYDIYYFINEFNLKELSAIKKQITVIYRNYSHKNNYNDILKTKFFCKKKRFKFFLSNNIRLAMRLDLDGVYLPAFNKKLNYLNISKKKRFSIIGSAHNLTEIRIKESQKCQKIFISPLFKNEKSKKFLGVIRFNLLANNTKKSIVCLGGIQSKNLRKVRLTKSIGIASISWIKKNGLNKNLGRF